MLQGIKIFNVVSYPSSKVRIDWVEWMKNIHTYSLFLLLASKYIRFQAYEICTHYAQKLLWQEKTSFQIYSKLNATIWIKYCQIQAFIDFDRFMSSLL